MVVHRTATAADADRIHELWANTGLSHGRDVDLAEIGERLRNDDGFFVVGELDDDLVSVAMGCYDDHRGWMKRVAVHPEHRGSGLGRRVVAEVERRFLDAGVSKLRLAVWSENHGGLAFWRDLDYEELPEIHYFVKDLGPAPSDR